MSPRRIGGFTLVELMVTVAVLAILSAIAYPSFQGVIRSNRVATTTNELIASVSLARAEAVRNNRGSSICASASGLGCDGNWADGWIVFSDRNGNGTVDADEAVLRYSQGRSDMLVSGPANFVHFDSRGRRTSTEADAGSLAVQPAECGGGEYRRELAISPTGQVRKDGGLVACH
ncbi:GspH/FimT family pseudopilin [[Pseudomonas] boreopolis]|uniref:GspH/FimT family pseudopilin n=1 Tax=Xanthomonas boreopolis TaxID=86183 RepID=UPI003D45D952